MFLRMNKTRRVVLHIPMQITEAQCERKLGALRFGMGTSRPEAGTVSTHFGHESIVPLKRNRKEPWGCDRQKHEWRNVAERLFHRLKPSRKVCTRYDKPISCFATIQFAVTAIWGQWWQYARNDLPSHAALLHGTCMAGYPTILRKRSPVAVWRGFAICALAMRKASTVLQRRLLHPIGYASLGVTRVNPCRCRARSCCNIPG